MKCNICRDAQIIHLPIHRPLRVAEGDTVEIEPLSRSFTCPACAPYAETDRVTVFHAQTEVARDVLDRPGVWSSVAETHARILAGAIARATFMDLKKIDEKERAAGPVVVLRSRIGVVSPQAVASIEQRAIEAADKIVKDVADRAIASINLWGSYYGQQGVYKQEAARFINEAVRDVLAQHTERVKADGEQVRAEKAAGASGAHQGARGGGDRG